MDDLIKRIGGGYDGIIERIEFIGLNDCSVEISCFDVIEKKMINIVFYIQNLGEFRVFQKLDTYNRLLSSGIHYGKINGLFYLNIDACYELGESNDIDELRTSEVYFIGKSIDFEIKAYSDYKFKGVR